MMQSQFASFPANGATFITTRWILMLTVDNICVAITFSFKLRDFFFFFSFVWNTNSIHWQPHTHNLFLSFEWEFYRYSCILFRYFFLFSLFSFHWVHHCNWIDSGRKYLLKWRREICDRLEATLNWKKTLVLGCFSLIESL